MSAVRIRAPLCAVLLLAGCGGSDVVLGDGRDAGSPARPHDAGANGRDASLPDAPLFSEPRALAGISNTEGDDDDPSLSADRLLLYFNSKREGGLGHEDIWFASRDDAAAEWQPPQRLVELNTEARETGIALAPDGLRLWWSSDRDGGQGGLDVYGAERASREDAWSAAQPVSALDSAGDDLVSAVSSDGQTLLLARRDDEDDDYDLYAAQRDAASGAFSAPQALSELDSDDEESDGFLLGDGLQLIFTRDEDLMLARRTSASAPFGPPVPLATLNSDGDDRDAWASDPLDYVVFSSDRSGSYRLYEATR